MQPQNVPQQQPVPGQSAQPVLNPATTGGQPVQPAEKPVIPPGQPVANPGNNPGQPVNQPATVPNPACACPDIPPDTKFTCQQQVHLAYLTECEL